MDDFHRKGRDKMKDLERTEKKSVDELKDELLNILPKGDDGIVTTTVQFGDTYITVPFDNSVVKKALSTIGMKNRTILEVFGIKINVDVR